jgi:ADP-ribose pyrophosphatase YjhB (NUDIX family)
VRRGESLIDAAVRSFREETGLAVEVTGLLDVSEVIHHDRAGHSITITYAGRIVGGSLTAEPGYRRGRETPAWFSAEDLYGVAYHPPRDVDQALRISADMDAPRFPFDCISDFIFVEHEVGCADIILVPGGSAPELMHRASELYARGLAPYILPSGGPNPRLPGYASEWAFLKDVGTAASIPEQAILREDRATNTLENARYSWDVVTREGLNVSSAILVGKAHHSRRALLTYQAVFPIECQFMVSPIVDRRGITKENWFLDPGQVQDFL